MYGPWTWFIPECMQWSVCVGIIIPSTDSVSYYYTHCCYTVTSVLANFCWGLTLRELYISHWCMCTLTTKICCSHLLVLTSKFFSMFIQYNISKVVQKNCQWEARVVSCSMLWNCWKYVHTCTSLQLPSHTYSVKVVRCEYPLNTFAQDMVTLMQTMSVVKLKQEGKQGD